MFSSARTPSADEIKEVLTISSRKYESIRLMGTKAPFSSEVKHFLKIRSRKWKMVHLSAVCFETASDFLGVLSFIDQTVVDLKISDVNIADHTHIEGCALTFPKLKILTLYDERPSGHINAFVNCTTLKEYSKEQYLTDSDNSKINKMLKRNKGLQKLRILVPNSEKIVIPEGIKCKLASLIKKHAN